MLPCSKSWNSEFESTGKKKSFRTSQMRCAHWIQSVFFAVAKIMDCKSRGWGVVQLCGSALCYSHLMGRPWWSVMTDLSWGEQLRFFPDFASEREQSRAPWISSSSSLYPESSCCACSQPKWATNFCKPFPVPLPPQPQPLCPPRGRPP